MPYPTLGIGVFFLSPYGDRLAGSVIPGCSAQNHLACSALNVSGGFLDAPIYMGLAVIKRWDLTLPFDKIYFFIKCGHEKACNYRH